MRPVTDLQRRVAPFEVITEMVPAGAKNANFSPFHISQEYRAAAKTVTFPGNPQWVRDLSVFGRPPRWRPND